MDGFLQGKTEMTIVLVLLLLFGSCAREKKEKLESDEIRVQKIFDNYVEILIKALESSEEKWAKYALEEYKKTNFRVCVPCKNLYIKDKGIKKYGNRWFCDDCREGK